MIAGACTVRVRYSDTDAMRVAHHTRHVAWFEVGRTELLRAAGYPYERLEGEGIGLPVIDMTLRFRAAARYDDLLRIETKVADATPVLVTFEYAIRRPTDDRLLATGRTDHAAVDMAFRRVRLPQSVRDVLTGEGFFDTAGAPC